MNRQQQQQQYIYENEQIRALENKWSTPRYQLILRPYSAHNIVTKRGNQYLFYSSNKHAWTLWHTLQHKRLTSSCISTFGSVDVIQALHASKHGDAVFISGTHVSLAPNKPVEPSPRQAGYTFDSIPSIVAQISTAQHLYTVKDKNGVDYIKPIVADADNGHGSTSVLMQTTKMLVENGAAGILIDDQCLGTYSTNSLFGKVIVPLFKSVNRLVSIRAQLDIMDVDHLIVCRTDSNEATLISSNTDIRDHRFILGATNPVQSMVKILEQAAAFGASDEKLMQLERDWMQEAKLETYVDAVSNNITKKFAHLNNVKHIIDQWNKNTMCLSIDDMKKEALKLGIDIFWSSEYARTTQGYYRYKGGVSAAISRGTYLASYCDVLCYGSSEPDYNEAKLFSEGIKLNHKDLLLGFDFTTSYNWDARGLSEQGLKNASSLLASMGYAWQTIKTGGVHATSLMSEQFCNDLSKRGIMAYIEDIQRPEKYNNLNSTNFHIESIITYYSKTNGLSQRSNVIISATTSDSEDIKARNQFIDYINNVPAAVPFPISANNLNNCVDLDRKRYIEQLMFNFYLHYNHTTNNPANQVYQYIPFYKSHL